jgi:hypothetical protein
MRPLAQQIHIEVIRAAAKVAGVGYSTMYCRVHIYGMSLLEAVRTIKNRRRPRQPKYPENPYNKKNRELHRK